MTNCLAKSWYASDNGNIDLAVLQMLMIFIMVTRVQSKNIPNLAHLAVDINSEQSLLKLTNRVPKMWSY